MRLLFLCTLILLSFNSLSQSTNENWIIATSTKDGEKWYVFKEYVSKENGFIKIWIKANIQKEKIKGVEYKDIEVRSLEILNCKTKKYSTISVNIYSNSGTIIESNQGENEKYYDVIPDTIMYDIMKKICELFDN